MNYQKSHREYPCCFCWKSGEQKIAGHHIRSLFQSGTGHKPHDIFTIPVCNSCHTECHDFTISKKHQVSAMLANWEKRGVELLGMQEYWKRVGEFHAGMFE